MNEKVYPISLYIKHKPNAIMLGIAAALQLATWGMLIYYIRPQEDLLFLHYNALFGVDLIGPWSQVYYLPISGLAILLLNATIGLLLFRKARSIGYVANGLSTFLQLIIFISSYLIILLNV